MARRALITGITGQDGSYLAEFLLGKGYEVHGIIRRASSFNTDRLDTLYRDPHSSGAPLHLHYGDLADATVLRRILERVEPDEVYNLGAQSHVKVSFEESEYTADIVGVGTLRLLDSLTDYRARTRREVRFYQAGSSEMFGATAPPQSETSPFYPRSPYAAAKVAAHWFTVNYREAYGLFACNGILFNHESPRRGETFVTRKITRAVGRIKAGLQKRLFLGNLEARRDWGFAGDYVEAMWLMLQQDAPDDYVIATGEAYSVRQFVQAAFAAADMDWQEFVEIDPRYFRATEVDFLQGDPSKAARKLRWKPRVSFDQLVSMMVDHDIELARQERTLRSAGHEVALRGAATL
ncbi:MAG TPA: GDP-mannose 4,6-dehydratase [Vicinamibacterales bacterium]|nr:GDP-mannose 4,6-dehydratase [Vicinamibacterales bacterium]